MENRIKTSQLSTSINAEIAQCAQVLGVLFSQPLEYFEGELDLVQCRLNYLLKIRDIMNGVNDEQAEYDRIMQEWCPQLMTEEQKQIWAANQIQSSMTTNIDEKLGASTPEEKAWDTAKTLQSEWGSPEDYNNSSKQPVDFSIDSNTPVTEELLTAQGWLPACETTSLQHCEIVKFITVVDERITSMTDQLFNKSKGSFSYRLPLGMSWDDSAPEPKEYYKLVK